MAKAPATYTIIKTRRGRQSEATGTVAELTKHFEYTLQCGNSYNPKINLEPKTAKSLVSALNKSVSEIQRGSFDPDDYQLSE